MLDALTAEQGLRVFHAAKQDLEAFYLTYGALPQPIFDTQIAAALIGYPPQIGYATLVKELFGVELDKDATRTDWSRRPLTQAQLSYAEKDVVYLPEMHEILKEKLAAASRYAWALQDSAALLDKDLYAPSVDDAWRRIAKIRYLPVPAQARARRLCAWREIRARTLDRPRQWILTDKALLDVATQGPETEAALTKVTDIPPAVIRKQGRQILDEMANANKDVRNGDTNFEQVRKPTPPDPHLLKKLGAIVRTTADELGFAPEILATRKEFSELIRGKTDLRVLTGWRKEVVGDILLKAL